MDSNELDQELKKSLENCDRELKEDEEFCSKDLDDIFKYLTNLEKKFAEKIQDYRTRLEQLRLENEETSKKNRQYFQEQVQSIEQLYRNQKYAEAKRKLREYENQFSKRTQILRRIPRCSLTLDALDQFFPLNIIEKKESQVDDDEEQFLTTKEKLRREKTFETIRFDQDEDFGNDKSEDIQEKSTFGILSRQQQRPIDPLPQRKFAFSTRLTPTVNSRPSSSSNTSSISKQSRISADPNLTLNPSTSNCS